uniref:Uncharacterized protein n=1 Tax=Rhodnius prolixus TaxID=13249 RepID=T1HES6_RHOPR
MTEETTIDCLLFSFKNFKFDRLVRDISSNATSCIEECLLTQSLVYDATLEVILLHLFKYRYGYILRADTWIGLCCDKEDCYCLIEFFTDRDNLKMSDLLLLEGCMIKIIGVRIVDFTSVDSTLAGLINFVHTNSKNRSFVYKGQVLMHNPEIICLRKSLWPKIASSIDYILIEDKDLKRYSVRVELIRTTSRGLCISDGNSQRTVLLNCTEPLTFSDLKVPFLADAIYYLKGELFADTYSKMLNI